MNKLSLVSLVSLVSLLVNQAQAMDELGIDYTKGPLKKYFEPDTLNKLSKGAYYILHSKNHLFMTSSMKNLQLLSQRLYEADCKESHPPFQGQLLATNNPYDANSTDECKKMFGDMIAHYHSNYLNAIMERSNDHPLQLTAIIINSTEEPLAVNVKGYYTETGEYDYNFTQVRPNHSLMITLQQNEPSSNALTIPITLLSDLTKIKHVTPTMNVKKYKVVYKDSSQ